MDNKSELKNAFWINIMEKLNAATDPEELLSGILEEACLYFGLGSAFIYNADPYGRGFFTIQEYYARYTDVRLPKFIDLHSILGDEGLEELAGLHITFSCEQVKQCKVVSSMVKVFRENFLMLVPVTDQKNAVIALVGFSDRRSCGDMDEEDKSLAHAILCSVAGHVKLRLYQQRVGNAQRALEGILDNMGVDVYVNDFFTHEILYVNRFMAEPYGGVEQMLGKKCWATLYEDRVGPCDYCPQPKLIDENGNPTKIFSWDYQRPFDGSWFRVLSAAFQWSDGRLAHVVSSVDITKNKNNEEIIRQLAELDTLIGLPNRRALYADCESKIQRAGDFEGFYVFFFDLDNLKEINDEYGHRAGDELLIQIGKTFQEADLTKDRVYRHGGDEFVLLQDDDDITVVREIIGSIEETFSRVVNVYCNTCEYTASVGISHYPSDGRTVKDLIHYADLAMYQSKSKGSGLVHFYNGGDICNAGSYFELHKARDDSKPN